VNIIAEHQRHSRQHAIIAAMRGYFAESRPGMTTPRTSRGPSGAPEWRPSDIEIDRKEDRANRRRDDLLHAEGSDPSC
jgi:hypothetical protein